MDDLDRLYRRLVQNIRGRRPEYLQIPFTVQELYEQLVPYRHNRRELTIETNQDYEQAVARLLSGERGYAQADPAMQDALRREIASPTGDPAGVFKEYAQTQITLAPVQEVSRTSSAVPVSTSTPMTAAANTSSGTAGASSTDATSAAATVQPSTTPVDSAGAAATAAFDLLSPGVAEPVAQGVPSLLSSLSNIEVPTGCRFCGGTLPEGRDVHYCPHCGQNLKTRRCPACGVEMDSSWKFCVTCGRKAG